MRERGGGERESERERWGRERVRERGGGRGLEGREPERLCLFC